MAQKLDKETLFNDFFETAKEVFIKFESTFCIENVASQFFGQPLDDSNYDEPLTDKKKALAYVKQSDAWQSLSRLYDYAIEGILNDPNPDEIVEVAAEVLQYLDTYTVSPSDDWDYVVRQGDGRFALDEGMDILIDKLQLIARVDIRTIRNSISSGALAAYKEDGYTFIKNESAREWLSKRRSFIPTRILTTTDLSTDNVSSPIELAAFLKSQRDKLGLDTKDKKISFIHPAINFQTLSDIEDGVFTLPLDTVFPLADFYQIDKKLFLDMIMRVYYKDQLNLICEETK